MDENLVGLLTIAIGGTGIVGIVGLIIQNSRATRLRHAVREAQAIVQTGGLSGNAEPAMRTAATLDAYRLAAISLIPWRLGPVDWVVIALTPFFVWGISEIAIAFSRDLAGLLAPTLEITWFAISLGIAFIAGVLTSKNRSIQKDRAQLVGQMLDGQTIEIEVRGRAIELSVPAEGTRRPI
ncbi:hypothetical protein HDC37_003412 [Microbacterium sp. AK009]|uniref:hypothetical protein n=1 Tax=Microbacterium sp. AK009 TaxID=2723068 RepID=UPI0015C876DF|nr:hypothetical protein [Microbacterium sp. AK009]NYF18547.1 hypothetical protein [Microbacterium sp. AK009]